MRQHYSLLIALFLAAFCTAKAQIVINEVQSSNAATLPDEDGDFPDWVELYNAGTNAANLEGMHLGDDFGDPSTMWAFPDWVLAPQQFLIVFASDKNRLGPTFLHTDFKISASGEMLLLTDANGIALDFVNVPPLSTGQSYAKLPDGSGNWVIMQSPTPGQANGQGVPFAPLEFSHQGGFYEQAFKLQLSTPNGGHHIHYTFNGAEPTVDDPSYQSPIAINDPTGQPYLYANIKTTELTGDYRWVQPEAGLPQCKVVRAAVFNADGERASPVATHSYFVGADVATRFPYPVLSLAAKPADLFSNGSGIYVPGDFFNPDVDNWEWTGNFFQKGQAWERPVHLGLFLPDGQPQLAQDAGVRIHGQRSRAAPQKTLRTYARAEYGNSTFDYRLFGEVESDSYKRFLIRTPMSDWSRTLFKDAACHELLRNYADLDLMASRTVLLFVNGEYWGIHNLRERQDEHYIANHYAINPDDVLLYEPWGTAINGNHPEFADYRHFVLENDLGLPENYDYVKQHADIDNFIDYQIAHIYLQNRDWPGNNEKIWRPDSPNAKFRWFFFDVDAGMYDAGANSLEWATDEEKGWSTAPLRKLLQNTEFRQKFIGRFVWHLNNTFEPERFVSIIENLEQRYAPEMERYIGRWGDPSSKADWRKRVDGLKEFARLRPCYMREHLMSFFGLPEEEVEVAACKLTVEGGGFVYPNPNSGNFWIAVGEDFPQNVTDADLSLYTPDGRLAYTAQASISPSGGTSKLISLPQLNAGLYIAELRTEGFNTKMKMVVR